MNVTKPDMASGERSSPGRLLIVDDDPTTCQLLALQLEMEGYSCATLSDPGQILEVIVEEAPALILVDYHLGTYNGIDMLRTIRNHGACRDLPVVIMSALNYERESEAAGANGFVLKPFSLQDLLKTIQEALKPQ
jgi:putative two-component system response regulator